MDKHWRGLFGIVRQIMATAYNISFAFQWKCNESKDWNEQNKLQKKKNRLWNCCCMIVASVARLLNNVQYFKFQILKVFHFMSIVHWNLNFNGRSCFVIHCNESVVLSIIKKNPYISMTNLRHVQIWCVSNFQQDHKTETGIKVLNVNRSVVLE